MCGIVGIVDPNLGREEIQPTIEDMNATIFHRGPDDEGFFVADGVGLGMRRLSIIDLAGGHQPMYNEDSSLVVVFNGEIYNYRDISENLRRRGHVLATSSDTEVLVHLYEEYGERCVEHLRGMFAFAIWDKRRRELFVARDRLGIKPLYYAEVGGGLVFGSEIKSLLQCPGLEARADIEAVSQFLSLKYVAAPLTMFQGIASLPPGHFLKWGQGLSVRRYWDVEFPDERSSPRASEESYAEQLEELLNTSVKLRLRSDVPFGAFLSGGLDSSIVVALMSQFLQEPVKTFSIGFDPQSGLADELPSARLIADEFHTDHHEVHTSPQDFVDLIEKVTWHLDQPIADQATVATYILSRRAAQSVKMVLTGEGGDELFAGYSRYAGERFSPLFRMMPKPVRSLIVASGGRVPGLRRPKIAMYALCQPNENTRFTNWFPLFNFDQKLDVLSTELKQTLNGLSSDYVFGEHLARTRARSPLNRMLYVDTKLWLPDFLLLRGDKLTMANSLEARVPLLDHELVQFAASLPPDLKLKRLVRKYLLKKVGRKMLPKAIIDRKKQGFPIPVFDWLRKEARPLLRDTLTPQAVRRRGILDPKRVETMLTEYDAGNKGHAHGLLGLLTLELWYRCFIDSGQRRSQQTSAGQYATRSGR